MTSHRGLILIQPLSQSPSFLLIVLLFSFSFPRFFPTLLPLVQMAVMISLGFLVAWAPYVAASLWSMFHPADQGGSLPPVLSLLPCLFAKSSTAYNPFIYFVFQRSFRRELQRFRKHVCDCCGDGGGSGGAVQAMDIKQEHVQCNGANTGVLGGDLSVRRSKADETRCHGEQPGREMNRLP